MTCQKYNEKNSTTCIDHNAFKKSFKICLVVFKLIQTFTFHSRVSKNGGGKDARPKTNSLQNDGSWAQN